MNRSAKGLLIVTTTFDGLVWQITDNLPNFVPAKLSRYTVIHITHHYPYLYSINNKLQTLH